ncbi:MAG: hypothetical protein K2K93_08810 [Muribaculaceae bacterium]|nr:hypothetical protein [Muribaculaceae bacterium]
METTGRIDKQLEESVRIALRDFGVGILAEDRLMGILKDYQGFRYFSAAEYIVRTLIADGTFSRLHSAASGDKKVQDYLLRETARLNRKYGFSRTYLQRILLSFTAGFGYPVYNIKIEDIKIVGNKDTEANQSPRPQPQPQPTPKPNSNSNTTKTPGGNARKNPSAGWSFRRAMIISGILLAGVCILSFYDISANKDNNNPLIKEVPVDDQTDTIVTAHADTIDHDLINEILEKYAKHNQKGRWRESTESEDYESEYEEGYEDGYEDGLAE